MQCFSPYPRFARLGTWTSAVARNLAPSGPIPLFARLSIAGMCLWVLDLNITTATSKPCIKTCSTHTHTSVWIGTGSEQAGLPLPLLQRHRGHCHLTCSGRRCAWTDTGQAQMVGWWAMCAAHYGQHDSPRIYADHVPQSNQPRENTRHGARQCSDAIFAKVVAVQSTINQGPKDIQTVPCTTKDSLTRNDVTYYDVGTKTMHRQLTHSRVCSSGVPASARATGWTPSAFRELPPNLPSKGARWKMTIT